MAKSGTRFSGSSKGAKSRASVRSATTSAGSSRLAAPAKTSAENITIVSRDERRPGKTDWAVVDALTDREIAAAVRKDADAVPLDFDWSEAVLIAPPAKQAISIRVDEDVLDFFKAGGAGYQSRMNAVLRHFVNEQKKPQPQKKKVRA